MPLDKDLKRLVRARMAATTENYTTARAALVPLGPPWCLPSPGST